MTTTDPDKSTLMALHDPLALPPAAQPTQRWTWGFAAVSWLAAFTLIAILWHVAQRPPVLPQLVPPVFLQSPLPAPAPADGAETISTVGPKAIRVPVSEKKPHAQLCNRRPPAPPLASKCCGSDSDDPLAGADVDDQPLGIGPLHKPHKSKTP